MEVTKPKQITLSPDTIIVLSKQNAETFHAQVRSMIYETGYGAFEYLETIAFFARLNDIIRGKEGDPGDKEFIQYVRDEIEKHPKGKFLSDRGVRFETAEVGTKYDFSVCNDPELADLECKLTQIKTKIDTRKDLLKALPPEGQDIITGEGEVVKLYPPVKSSKSSIKITLAK